MTLLCVCGLHGGAGTTTLALALARHAAARRPAGTVVLIEADPCGGTLASVTGAHSDHGLHDLGDHHDRRQPPPGSPAVQLSDGLRLTACAAPRQRDPACAEATIAVLHDARRAHQLTVIDAGIVREPTARMALAAANAVVWTTSATTPPAVPRTLLAGPLAQPARHATWILAVIDTAASRQRPALSELQTIAPTAAATVLVPAGLEPSDDHDRGDHALAAILGALGA